MCAFVCMIHVCTCVHECVHACMRVCVCVCVCACVCLWWKCRCHACVSVCIILQQANSQANTTIGITTVQATTMAGERAESIPV